MHRAIPCCVPIVDPYIPSVHDGPERVLQSKFGGKFPLLTDDYTWPRCEICKSTLAFFFQINETDLPMEGRAIISPESPSNPAMFQFFYCTEGQHLTCREVRSPCCARRVPLPSVAGAASQPPLSRDGTERAVIPDFVREEAEVFVDWDIQFRPITGFVSVWEFPFMEEDESGRIPPGLLDRMSRFFPMFNNTDHLGGDPGWSQGEEFPTCPQCEDLMTTVVFTLMSDVSVNYCFGDLGSGQICRCPRHPDRFGFVWAC